MPSFAATASLRVIILTNAWRLSTFTIHVCTLPKVVKIARNSSSEDLQIDQTEITRFQVTNLRYTTDEESPTKYLMDVSPASWFEV